MKPSIPRGTRDFGPAEMRRRLHIINIIRRNFELFGFEPIETPSMENIGTLTGKYGDEGDQLIFKILNSRLHESSEKDKLKSAFDQTLESSRNLEILTEKALRYDLTVPFARFVVMNQHAITFPFRRYQIQPVWRADKPQKGRYREFYQCDADVIGSNSLINEVEFVLMMDKAFRELNLPAILKINNRKILSALAAYIGHEEKIIDITVAIDKLDKVGKEGVRKELQAKGISAEAISKLEPLLDFEGGNEEKLNLLKNLLKGNEPGEKGLEELAELMNGAASAGLHHVKLEIDITLARGLNYYTGTIFEVKAAEGSLRSSLLGGGRYDDLTGVFGLKNMSGVGISFGIDRIYDVCEELQLFPAEIAETNTTKIMFAHFDAETRNFCLHQATELRKNDIACEVFPDLTKKLGKQFDYANKKKIPYVCTVGSDEMQKGLFSIKNMNSGVQQTLGIKDLIEYIKTN